MLRPPRRSRLRSPWWCLPLLLPCRAQVPLAPAEAWAWGGAAAPPHTAGAYGARGAAALPTRPAARRSAAGAAVPGTATSQAWSFAQGDARSLNETAQQRARRLQTSGVTGLYFEPAQDNQPPGGFPGGGPLVLYAGRNYSRWQVLTADPQLTDSRLRMVDTVFNDDWAIQGRCVLEEDFSWPHIISPLMGRTDIPPSSTPQGAAWVSPPELPMVFQQGVTFKFCWSPMGTFSIADAWIVPDEDTIFNVYGAIDTCAANGYGPECLKYRRFYKHAPHKEYEYYLQQDDQQFVFIQALYLNPMIYTRLAYMLGDTCGHEVGDGTLQAATAWQTPVDPLDMIFIGNVRTDMEHGYRNLLCLCPAFDETHELMPNNDGHCEQENDFVQQVGMIFTLMASFLDCEGNLSQQVVPSTRFTIKVDCGDGPWCDTAPHERLKVIDRDWPPVRSDLDNMHWWTGALGPCPTATETSWWWTPKNCYDDATDTKTSSNCMLDGGMDESVKYFGTNEVRFLARYESGVGIAQNFDFCFVHKPLEVDGIDPSTFDSASDDALQNASRVFWKLGQMIVLPLRLKDADYVANKPTEVKVSTEDSTLSNNLQPSNSILKVLQQVDREAFSIGPHTCNSDLSLESYVYGITCNSSTDCEPRAHKGTDNMLYLNGGDPDHRVTFRVPGTAAVCYCENYDDTDPNSCTNELEWIVVGKALVAGPASTQDYILDVGFIQSFELKGVGFSDLNTIRILEPGYFCDAEGLAKPDERVTYCPPWLGGVCQLHGFGENDTHISDIPGDVRRHNSTLPEAYITSLTQDANRNTVLTFAEIPVLEVGDILHFDSNIMPWAPHWAREQDLLEIFHGRIGHEVLDLQQNGVIARVDMKFDGDLPPHDIDPPEQGRWYRSSKLRVMHIKGGSEVSQMSVCWGNEAGSYWAWGGYMTLKNPAYMEDVFLGITSTVVGTVAPHLVWFKTGGSPEYVKPNNSMQLRLVFSDTSILAPADSSPYGTALEPMYDADQLHEASQAVCGKLFVELWSNHEMGFPVPQGCYVDSNYYATSGRMVALYMLFAPKNGLASSTDYKIVMNMEFRQAMAIADYASLETPLIEVSALDDVLIKPEGIVEVAWANPDKAIVNGAGPLDQGFLPDSGITVIEGVGEDGSTYAADGDVVIMDHPSQLGFSFLIRGSDTGHVRPGAILRFIMMPLTIWDLTYRERCKATCWPQEGYECGPDLAMCRYEATITKCTDIIPPYYREFIDTKEHTCEYFEIDGKCESDGISYTPSHGISALEACCACDGGIRFESNILKLQMPFQMSNAYGHDIIHTVRVWEIGQVPLQGFFATRFGVQMTDETDALPAWTITNGKYLARMTKNTFIDPVATLVAVDDWGNSRPFKGDPLPNDFYMRLQMPFTLFGSEDGFTEIKIILPEDYVCQHVLPAVPRDEFGIDVQLPTLPELSPTGNGGLPSSNVTYVGVSSGTWYFEANICRFVFDPYMVLYTGQRLYLYILALNPLDPLGHSDPRNVWGVNFSSSGHAFYPPNLTVPCAPYLPPNCMELGEDYFVNPIGIPPWTQSFELLYPNASSLSREMEPVTVSVPTNLTLEPNAEEWYTDKFAVLGILTDVVLQPTKMYWGSATTFDLWFQPDQGIHYLGSLQIQCPLGFQFAPNCNARDLADLHYSTYAPPYGDGSPRIWRMEEMETCFAEDPNHSAMIPVGGSMAPDRLYGLRVDVLTVGAYSENLHGFDWRGNSKWRFLLTIYDGLGYPLDGTYTEATFYPDDELTVYKPYERDVVRDENVGDSIAYMDQTLMYPMIWTNTRVEVEFGPLVFDMIVQGQLRVTAPDGYEWYYDINNVEATFQIANLAPCVAHPGQTLPMPGGAPPLKNVSGRLNVIAWPGYDVYDKDVAYCFKTSVLLPQMPPRKSANVYYLEWGYGEDFVPSAAGLGRLIATREDAPDLLVLRNARMEVTSTVGLDSMQTMWLHVQLMSNITGNGSLEIRLPRSYNSIVLESNYDPYRPELSFMYLQAITVEEWGSQPLGEDFEARWLRYEYSMSGGAEYHILITCNQTGIPAGRYIFEINITDNPLRFINTADDQQTCNYAYCTEFFSFKVAPVVEWNNASKRWDTMEVADPALWATQHDYWSSIPARFMGSRMTLCEMINLTLDERLEVGKNDRPHQRSVAIFAIELASYTPTSDDVLRILAPVGWEFDGWCEFWTDSYDIFPISGLPNEYYRHGVLYSDVTPWPASAVVRACRGDNETATIRLDAGLEFGKLYMFKIGIKKNPKRTPLDYRNVWLVDYGEESSGAIPGFRVWTFNNYFLDPVSLAWTDVEGPQRSPAILQFQTVNELIPTFMHGAYMLPMLRLVMPPMYEVFVDGGWQDINGGTCFAQIVEVGDCGLCGIPWDPKHIECTRETNRKNVAMVVIIDMEGAIFPEPRTYAVAVDIYNPHIQDDKQSEPPPWIVETFLGEPVPFSFAPYGYQLDWTEVPGYKIAGRANLTVEYEEDHNGSTVIPAKDFSMSFPALAEAGDIIEVRAPLGFEFFEEVPGLYVRTQCRNFSWEPSTDWPVDINSHPEEEEWWYPPERGPLPPEEPYWFETPPYAENETLIVYIPLNITNVSRAYDEGMEILYSEGMPNWTHEAAFAEHVIVNESNASASLVLRAHCMSNASIMSDTSLDPTLISWNESLAGRTVHPNATYVSDLRGFNWSKIDMLGGSNLTFSLVNITLPGNWNSLTSPPGGDDPNVTNCSNSDGGDDPNGTNCSNSDGGDDPNGTNSSNSDGGDDPNGTNSSNSDDDDGDDDDDNRHQHVQIVATQFCLRTSWINPAGEVCVNACLNEMLTANGTNGTDGADDADGGADESTNESSACDEANVTLQDVECYPAVIEEYPELCWVVPVIELPLNSSEVDAANNSYEALDALLTDGNVTILDFRINPPPRSRECQELATIMALGDALNCTSYTTYDLSDLDTTNLDFTNLTEEELWFMFNETGNVTQIITEVCENFTLPTSPELCECDESFGGMYVLDVLWSSMSDLATDIEHYAAVYQWELELRNWDLYPIRAEPFCEGSTMVFSLTEDNIHPDPDFRYKATFRFKAGYKNAKQPPLDFQNYWLLRHTKDVLSSSAAVLGWDIVGQFRYVRIDLLNEVLLPHHYADLHFEFVTVNPLDWLQIIAVEPGPEGWNFVDAVVPEMWITNPGHTNDEATARRLQVEFEWSTPYTWKGFTEGVYMDEDSKTINSIVVTFSPKVTREQYVRFRVHQVYMPWDGGQAIFHLYGKASDYPQDQLERCCEPGYPPGNPGKVFSVPYRLEGMEYLLQNKYQQDGNTYPIAYMFETRYNEEAKVTFQFRVPVPVVAEDGQNLLIRARLPDGYEFASPGISLEDSSVCLEIPGGSGCGRVSYSTSTVYQVFNITEVRVDTLRELGPDMLYFLVFDVITPFNSSYKDLSSLWVYEITDTARAAQPGLDGMSLMYGSMYDIPQISQVNFSVWPHPAPPEVTVVVNVTLYDLGEVVPSLVEVHPPFGYEVAWDCFDPVQDPNVSESFVSCRYRWAIYGTTYMDEGVLTVRELHLPITIRFIVRTPRETPEANNWYVRCKFKDGYSSWGIYEDAFLIEKMFADVSYTALSNTTVELYLTVQSRYALPWNGSIHVAAPRTYKMFCPPTVVTGNQEPTCVADDPVLVGCYGLPGPNEPNPYGLQVCEPQHEVLLVYSGPPHGENAANGTSNAIDPEATLLFSILVHVPVETPDFSENVFRIRTLDATDFPIDANLDVSGLEVRDGPRISDVSLWWKSSNPGMKVTIAIEFEFLSPVMRPEEDPETILETIEIEFPENHTIGASNYKDVVKLTTDPGTPEVPVTVWNWTVDTMPRKLFFALNLTANVTGKFHYSFPVILPTEDQGMPGSNLWRINFCTDQPYCSTLILSTQMLGLEFHDPSPFYFDIEAAMGSAAWRQHSPTCLWALLTLTLSCLGASGRTLSMQQLPGG